MLWRLYQRYDRLTEPARFMIFIAFLIPIMIAATNPYQPVVAAIGWSLVLFLIVTRWWHLYVRPRLAKRQQCRQAAREQGSS